MRIDSFYDHKISLGVPEGSRQGGLVLIGKDRGRRGGEKTGGAAKSVHGNINLSNGYIW